MKNKKVFLPLVIDPHVHSRDMDQKNVMTVMQTFKEAAESGVGVCCLMPNTSPSIDNENTLNDYLRLIEDAERKTGVTGYVWVALTDTNHNEVIRMLHYKKVIGIKIYPLGVTTGTCGIRKWESLEKLLQLMREKNIDKPIAGHWEDPEVIELEGHSVNAEVSALKKLIEIAREYPEFRYTACHITSAAGGNIIEDAQDDGLGIMIEFTVHHAFFCSEQVDVSNGKYKCFPPIKTCSDRSWIQMFIQDNADNPLVYIGSDTAPHPIDKKMGKNPPGGLATLQHIVPVMLTLMEDLELTENCIANLTSRNASRFLGIPYTTDTGIWSLEQYKDDRVYNNGKVLNPFEGELLTGKLVEVVKGD